MKKTTLLISIILLSNLMMAQNIIQYSKRKDNLQIQLVVKKINNTIAFQTLAENKKGEKIILDEIQAGSSLFKDENKYQFHNIIDFTKKEDSIFVFYNDFGKVFLLKFTFDNVKYTKTEIFIGKHKIISYENGGNMQSFMQMKWINNKLYFYMHASQMYGGKLKDLFVYSNDNVKRINFEQTRNVKDEKQIFRVLDLEQNKEKVNEEIKGILRKNYLLEQYEKFEYIGNIDVTPFKERGSRNLGGITYFFYQDTSTQTKIIRYDSDYNQWLIGDYKEEEIKQE
ncbi:MAG TPA: hypothetical protein VF677_02560 [Flavobacterium sp.]|jgi:hypothetical protein